MITFNQWKKSKTSLFAEIESVIGSPVFVPEDIEYIEMAFSHLYGNREIVSAIEESSISEVANKIAVLNKQKWTNQYELLYNEIVNGVANETTVSEQETTLNNRTLDRNTKENVSAYNDVDYSPDSENVEGLVDDTTGDKNITRSEQRKSLWAIQEQLRLAQQGFMQDVVFKDVAKMITLSIY